ncbi:zinc finger protein 197-like [Uranotaenia lowii]|uniref:zinc finger protein 197-like n=1 Tax=Uranotaenia lowii TaxID=190385 RepID=UPI00247871AF|nr:zinc finger protein 197-like [Uranotaenia lowii]XP_055598497.1 zinc finger protein 197-like [Uranotaenia lowii]
MGFLIDDEHEEHLECGIETEDTLQLQDYRTVAKSAPKVSCEICESLFATRHDLMAHMKQHTPKLTDLTRRKNFKRQCEFCPEKFEWKINAYNLHCQKVHNRTAYKCFICNKAFHLVSHLGEHIRSGHEENIVKQKIEESLWRTFVIEKNSIGECRICFRLLATKNSQMKHQAKHIKELSLTCSSCGGKHYHSLCCEPRAPYPSVYEKVECDICHQFVSKKNFREHQVTHKGQRDYPCTFCNKLFKVQRTARRHIQNHINAQNKRRKCYDCSAVFDDESQIPPHYKELHPAKHPYSCPICRTAGFYTRTELEDHCHKHTGLERSQVAAKKPVEQYKVDNAQVYECTLCRRSFSAKRTVVAHFLMHTDRPHVCAHCQASFRAKAALSDHMLDVHSLPP